MPLRSVMMKRFIFGFQRRVWCPKWTPLSRSWRMVTTAMVLLPVVSGRACCAHELVFSSTQGPTTGMGVPALTLVRGPTHRSGTAEPSPAWLRLDQEAGAARKQACEVNPCGLLEPLYPAAGGVVETPQAPAMAPVGVHTPAPGRLAHPRLIPGRRRRSRGTRWSHALLRPRTGGRPARTLGSARR